MRWLALAVALVACHGPLDVEVAADARGPSNPAWLRDPDLATRTTVAADSAVRLWGGSPSDLDGWTVRYVGKLNGLYGKATAVPILGGGTIELDVRASTMCLEATALAHEVGHVIIGDGGHTDRRWRDAAFDRLMADALAAGLPAGEDGCRRLLAEKKIL